MSWVLQHWRSSSRKNRWNVPVRNFGCVAPDRLYRGAMPAEAGYQGLASLGVNTVVSLVDSRTGRDDGLRARAAGLRWYHLPLSPKSAPTKDRVSKWLEWVSNETLLPIFVQSDGGRHRVGGLVAVYRISVDGWTPDDALAEAREFGFYTERGHAAWADFIRSYGAG